MERYHLNMEANHGCMQMITVKSKRYLSEKKISRGLVCLKIYRNLFFLGVTEGIWVRPNKMPHGFTRRFTQRILAELR